MAGTEALKMNLICGSTAVQVDKVVLYAKLKFFTTNPGLLNLSEYRTLTSVPPDIFTDFVRCVESSQFRVTGSNRAGLERLSDEFGFSALSEACRSFCGSVDVQGHDCTDVNALKVEVSTLKSRVADQDRHLEIMQQQLVSLQSDLRSLHDVSEAKIADVKRQIESEQDYRRFCELTFGVHRFSKSGHLGNQFLRRSADCGHSDAQYRYADHLLNGFFCRRDDKLAFDYASKSAGSGNSFGQNLLGVCHDHGWGVDRDAERAVEYYKLSADQGNAVGQSNMGIALQNGTGVAQDLRKAAEYFKLAADQGRAEGQYRYADCLGRGIGVSQDRVKAAEFEKLAADQGHASAQNHYAWCLANGFGVARDVAKAAVYYKQAADQGISTAQEGYRRSTAANSLWPQ